MNIERQLDVKVVERSQDPSDPYPEARRWLEANSDRNAFDPEVLKYANTMVLRVANAETWGYMPVQSAAFLESVALHDKLTPMERAQALINLSAAAERLTAMFDMREMYTLATDEITARAAVQVGFEVLPWAVLRKRVKA